MNNLQPAPASPKALETNASALRAIVTQLVEREHNLIGEKLYYALVGNTELHARAATTQRQAGVEALRAEAALHNAEGNPKLVASAENAIERVELHRKEQTATEDRLALCDPKQNGRGFSPAWAISVRDELAGALYNRGEPIHDVTQLLERLEDRIGREVARSNAKQPRLISKLEDLHDHNVLVGVGKAAKESQDQAVLTRVQRAIEQLEQRLASPSTLDDQTFKIRLLPRRTEFQRA